MSDFTDLLRETPAEAAIREQRASAGRDRLAPELPSLGTEWRSLADVEMRSIRFLDRPLLQAAAFHLLVGRKGAGKGTLLADIAARVTRGELGDKRNVVWVGSEDSEAIDVKPRIVAAGGDPARVFLPPEEMWLQLPEHVPAMADAIRSLGDVGMVVIDPLGNHIAGKNSNQETDTRDAIAPLNGLADEHDCMVFGVRHLTQKECRAGTLAAILGNSAWVQVPRAVLAIVADDVDRQIRHVQVVAGNRAKGGEEGRILRIEGVLLPGLEEEVTRAAWEGASGKDVEELLSGATGENGTSNTGRARELILDLLEDLDGGGIESDELDAKVANQIGLAAGTVRNIRTSLTKDGLVRPLPEKDGDGTVKKWIVYRTKAPRETVQ